MKKILAFLVLVLAIACKPAVGPVVTEPVVIVEPTTPEPVTDPVTPVEPVVPVVDTVTISVVNSLWEVVRTDKLVVSRDITSTDALQIEIDEYNSTHTDDQWVLYSTEVPPIEAAPVVDIYIVKADTHEIITEYQDVPRAEFAENKIYYQVDTAAAAGILYVDNIPPVPEPIIDLRSDYEKYAIYLVAADGSILYETHCEDFAGPGYASAEAYFPDRKRQFELQAQADGNGEYVIAGRLYP